MLVALLWHTASAATLEVGPGLPYATITDAVQAASSGDVVLIAAGTWSEPVVISSKALTLRAAGPVDWQGSGSTLLELQGADVTVEGITFWPGLMARAVTVDGGSLVMQSSRCEGDLWNGAFLEGTCVSASSPSTVTLRDSVFQNVYDNVNNLDGVTIHMAGSAGSALTIERSTFQNTYAGSRSPLYAQVGSVVIQDSYFYNNWGDGAGGGAFLYGGDVFVSGSTFESNYGGEIGGGIYVVRATSAVFVNDTFIQNGVMRGYGMGGGLGAIDCDVVVRSCRFLGNTADRGGGIYVEDSTLSLTRSALCQNEAYAGGAVMSTSALGTDVENNAFVENSATRVADLDLDGTSAIVRNNDFLGAAGTWAAYVGRGTLDLSDNLFAFGAGTPYAGVAPSTFRSNAYYQNTVPVSAVIGEGPFAILADPMLAGFALDGACSDDLRLLPGSPLIDAGTPGPLDVDGSALDVGVTGGVDADLGSWGDADADGDLDLWDCGPNDPQIHRGAVDVCDGVDQDCDGRPDWPAPPSAPVWYEDHDRDGFRGSPVAACVQPWGATATPEDCDDGSLFIFPGAAEHCDGVDESCDGVVDNNVVDAPVWFQDADADGSGAEGGLVTVNACELPPGFAADATDCDDADATVAPGLPERCDHLDNNCDGSVDGADAVDRTSWFRDADGDGFGAPGRSLLACDPPPGAAAPATDCDDANALAYPGAEEVCADPDLDCDGVAGTADRDGDGVGGCADCDDSNALSYPGAAETCADPDLDCDGVAGTADHDGDGVGGCADCDDSNALIHPGAAEVAGDGVDDDCDAGDVSPIVVPTPPTPRHGCDAANGSPTWAWLGLALFARRRPRSGSSRRSV